jgi:hypothetical protein
MRDVILIRLGKIKPIATNEIKYIIQRVFLKIKIKLFFIWGTQRDNYLHELVLYYLGQPKG